MARTNEAGNIEWPKLWYLPTKEHIDICRIGVDYMIIWYTNDHCPVPHDFFKDYRIITKSFSDLVNEVKENPKDNALVRAFGSGVIRNDYPFNDANFSYIKIRLTETDNVEARNDWQFCPNGNFHLDYSKAIDYLRSEGYPVGIPEDHTIHLSEIMK